MKSSPEQHMIMSEDKGLVFDIKRFAVHDGAGIRTTVFLKGCPFVVNGVKIQKDWIINSRYYI